MPTDLSTDMVDYQIERKAYENEINELGITVTSLKEELNAKKSCLQNEMWEKLLKTLQD